MNVCDKCKRAHGSVVTRLLHHDTLRRHGFVRMVPNADASKPPVEVTYDPKLCASCCAELPGREWMRDAAARQNRSDDL